MQKPKNIKIQVWTDNYYCKVIGIWRPHEEEGAIPEEPDPDSPTRYKDETKMNLPRYIVLSSVFEPRSEVMGNNPIAPGQHPIPKDFLEDQTRQISYMFANDMGIFTPPSKQIAGKFIARQTLNFKLIKEIEREVRPASGTMTAKDLRDSLNQFTDEELEKIPVLIVGENPKDAMKKDLSKFQYIDKNQEHLEDPIPQYLTVTKITPVFELDDPYISNSPIGEDHIERSLPPGTEDNPMSEEITKGAIELAEEAEMNKDVLETYDEMIAPKEDPVLDEDGNPKSEPSEPDRIAVLEELLKKKNQELIDAGLRPAPIQTEKEEIPEPAPPSFGASKPNG